ncbi:MAG: Co2+/Mg2+ efflux protein ApaG [Proteobacteria bacterium]|nr:Co2+/Mg2+ efflux protein ApaG [Pseudomonadota bacterium]
MYSQVTRAIKISVEPFFLEDQSAPDRGHYVWAYRVAIANQGNETVKLVRRYWRITDALGRIQEVRGEGVVGEQPVIGPGQRFVYTSGAPLGTPSGIMVGAYEMVSTSGERFEVAIPAFSLDSPHQKVRLN